MLPHMTLAPRRPVAPCVRFKQNTAYYRSFARYIKMYEEFGFTGQLNLVVVDGAAMGHHIGNSGHSAICGCCFCTRPKALKYVCGWAVTDPATLVLCGQLRTQKLNKKVMKKFEQKLRTHLKKDRAVYKEKDVDFDLKEWCKDGLIHRADHPALAWIVKWSREHGHSYRAVQVFEDVDTRNFIFDGLHGTINVIGILNKILRDIQTHNGCRCRVGTRCCCAPPLACPLVDIMAMVLPQLSVPGISSPAKPCLLVSARRMLTLARVLQVRTRRSTPSTRLTATTRSSSSTPSRTSCASCWASRLTPSRRRRSSWRRRPRAWT